MTTSPDSDRTCSFYFNGHELSEWAAHWHVCDLDIFLNGYRDDWDEFVGYQHIWHLQNRLDHVGVVESEDPLIFRVCAQEVLLALIRNREAVVGRIREAVSDGTSAPEVLDELIDGIARMIELVHRDGIAVWTSGSVADLDRLNGVILCHREATGGPSAELPHIRQRRAELSHRCGFQLKDLRSIAQSGTLDKRLRRVVNQLPNKTEQVGAPNH
ncbi:MAG: hypothetical protein RIS79_2999 [Verrucomicrobiota bacterium]|jgi:hypothetical protein